MSMQPYSDEELNYFKFASIVLKEFPDALRSIFVDMWDTRVAPSSTVWDDSPLVRNILHNNEAPNTKIPTNNSFKEWDCTALFQATLYAKIFALPDSTGKKKTLGEMYLKGRKPVPGPFHSAVRSSSGDKNETIALAIDQLRLLRNTLCHTSSPQINKVTFDDYVKHAKDAFTALNFSTTSLKRIGNMKESDFPTKEVEKLNEEINRLRSDFYLFLESEVKHEMSGVKYEMSGMKHELNSINKTLTQTKETTDQCTTTTDYEFKDFNDVLLLTVDDSEFNEAQKILNNVEISSKKDESDGNCCFGEIGRNKVTLLKVPYFGKTGVSSGHDVLDYKTIQELKPKAIVSLGICDGVRKEAHCLGDVVVSSQVYFAEQHDDGLSNFDRTTHDCNLGLVRLFHRGSFAWFGPCEDVLVPKVHVGQFTTGLQIGGNKKRDSHNAGTIGVDTAAKRVYATCQNSGVPWLSCKSITKWANDECQNSRRCQFGAAVSASYVQHVLKRFYIPDEVQVFDKSVPKPCLPPMVPHFIGRQQECEDIVRVLTSTSARLVSLSGPPGFGKTSLAIAVGHQLRQLGLPVYFLSLRSVKTTEELISDLLNSFAHVSSDVTGRERSKLCGLLSAIPSNICIVLDNADDLFESGGETSQDVLDLLEKIFSHCKNLSFLLTTRTSLQSVLGRKFAGHTSVGVASLDRKSSQMLVRELVPPADESECCRVAELCGDVPLAIMLLCGQIVDEKKSASQFLDHFSRSSKPVVELLDDPDAPNDQRLKVLFESYFKRLSREEQEAFVCLSVFFSEVFDEQAAVNVIGGDEDRAKKTLLRLKRKYLVEANCPEAVLFSFHPLIRSFGSEKAAVDMKEIAREAQRRFLSYYVKLFEDLNNQFLGGNSLLAFHDFELNKENMVRSLSEGLQNEFVCDAIFDVLSDADLFLDTVFYFEHGWMFDKIYNLAIAKAKEQRKFKAVHQLLIAKAVGEITWDDGATLTLLKEAEEIEKQNPLLTSEVVMGKRMCYHGIHLLIYRAAAKGGEILETGISLLSSENTVLKVLSSQILALITAHREKSSYCRNIVLTECANRPSLYAFFKAIQEDDCADEENENPKALSQPLILALALLINFIADCYDMKEVKYKLGLPISKLQKEVETKAQNDRLYLPLLLIVENTLAKVKIKQESATALQLALDNFIEENGRLNPDTADRYHFIGRTLYRQKNYDASLRSHYEALDIRLKLYGHNPDIANSYYQIGFTQFEKKDYESALQSFQQALDIKQYFHGKIHPDIADVCYFIGVTKHCLKQYDSAVHWLQQALDIRVALYGKEHPASASSYYWIAASQSEIQDYDSALESCQQALGIRLKLFGQESEDTYNSNLQMKLIRSRLKVCGSSLELVTQTGASSQHN